MSENPGAGRTFNAKALGLRDAGQQQIDVEVRSFTEIEAEAAKYGVTRADLEAAITKPSPSMQEMYAYLITRALMAQKEAASKKDKAKGYPISDHSDVNDPSIYTYVTREGDNYAAVHMTRTIQDQLSHYAVRREVVDGRPKYTAEYSGPKKAALPNAEGKNPFGGGLFNPKMQHEPLQSNDIQWVFSRLGGFPPNFMAQPAVSVAK